MDPPRTGDLEAQKPPEEKDENCDVKHDEPGTSAAGALSSESPRPSMNVESRDHALASKSEIGNRNSADPDTGGISQAPEGDPYIFASDSTPIIFFKHMAAMGILVLQNELAEVQKDITSAKISGEDKIQYSRRLEDLLHRYTTAIRDYGYMTGLDDTPDASSLLSFLSYRFPSSYPDKSDMERLFKRGRIRIKNPKTRSIAPSDPLRRFLSRILPGKLTWTEEEITKQDPLLLNELGQTAFRDHFKPKMISPSVDRLARFIVAITGGLSLVVPMLIMRTHQNPNKRLITTSVAVVLFSGVVSVGFSASNAETLGITAAYAAVLVVFVGTSAGGG